MIQKRSLVMWAFASAGIAAFVLGASAQEVVRAISQAVVTPANPIWAQDVPAPPTPQEGDTPQDNAAGGRGNQGGRGATPQQPRPYAQVITAAAKTDDGVFKVHRINDQIYYEIPRKELGKDFLWVNQVKRTVNGSGYGGQAAGNRVVRWELYNNRVLLKVIDYSVIADPATPIAKAVEAANNPSIVRAYNVAAFSANGEDPVIDVTQLFTTEVPELSVRGQVNGGRGFDAARTFIEKVVSFPENINVEVTQTFTAPVDAGAAAGAAPRGRGNSFTVLTSYSMVKLPEKPMMGRLFDERVGYFSQSMYDYSRDEHRAEQRTYVTRYRLEKKDPNAAISEPVKPIVYYIDPATPTRWIPYLKKGIEDWQPAFEAAGFRNAIIAKEAPKDDPDWSAEDARNSVIRWLPSTTENASGPNVHDPRSGEILEADIQFYHNVQNLQKNWYFVQVGPLDSRARTLPLPDDLMGRLLEFAITHEVGHTLGLQHNMKASSMYPASKLRDKDWIRKMGHTPSLMDYSRFNYVAQPEDGIDVADLVPSVGPYDIWAIGWGYRPIPGAASASAEKSTLDGWSRTQDDTPWLRFSTPDARGTDPGELTEAVGDQDAIASTALGLKNLERVASMLIPATSRPGEPYDDLEELYGRLLGQWSLELNHVAAIVGGLNSLQRHAGQDGVRFVPVPRQTQAAAVAFLNAHAFHVPAFAITPEILRRIEPAGALARIKVSQQRVLDSLFSSARLVRLVEQEAIDGASAYRLSAFLQDVRKGVWSEVYGTGPVRVDAYRRNLQRAYIETASERVSGRQATTDDARAFFRGELRTLDADLRLARARVTDRPTRMHIDDVRAQIARATDPAVQATSTAAPRPAIPQPGWDVTVEPDSCWTDYAINQAWIDSGSR